MIDKRKVYNKKRMYNLVMFILSVVLFIAAFFHLLQSFGEMHIFRIMLRLFLLLMLVVWGVGYFKQYKKYSENTK